MFQGRGNQGPRTTTHLQSNLFNDYAVTARGNKGTNAPHCFTDNDVNLIDELSLLQARGDVTSLPEHKVQNQREPSALSEAEVALLMDTLLGQLESELALM
eukprot:1155230-Pelagomonas_calceolata.AAC.2